MASETDTPQTRRPWIFTNKKVKRLLVILIATSHIIGLLCFVRPALELWRGSNGSLAQTM